MKRFIALLLPLAACLSTASCNPQAEKLEYRVVSTQPHDPAAYTQGFQWSAGRIFESTGLYGQSSLREIDPATGRVVRRRPLAKEVFGEGLTLHNGELWVLTWKEQTAYVFEPETFKFLRTYRYEGEGWGLTSNGQQLIMSDGSSTLKFINPTDFSVTRTLQVMDGKQPVDQLNELEWIDGQIYANIYTTHRIARISPETGRVTGWLDLSGLRNLLPRPNRAEVLNGVAHDPDTGHLWVTGKNWPLMFEIELTTQ
jgi:glutaminyl-peptide cyclotransferase